MREKVLFDDILSALHDATFDDANWPRASALIDEVCGSKGNILVWGDAAGVDTQVRFARCVYGGQRHREYEEEYFRKYHHIDEKVPRLRRLPDSKIVSIEELYTDEEKRTSIAYNEMLKRSDTSNCLHARLDGPDGSRITWTTADPIDDVGWSTGRVEMIARILPHIRQLMRVRLTLGNAGALGVAMAELLENTRCGIIQLDRRGRIVAVNQRALRRLREYDGLTDAKGCLHARKRGEDARLQALVKQALPRENGGRTRAGTMAVTRPLGSPPRLALHIIPVSGQTRDWGTPRVAAIVLVVEPETGTIAEPEFIAEVLDLTAAESRVAVMLAEGHTLRGIAAATGRSTGTVRWHLSQIFQKNRISRQVELVHLIRSLSVFTHGRD